MGSERVNSCQKGQDERVPEPTAKAGLPGFKTSLNLKKSTTARRSWTT